MKLRILTAGESTEKHPTPLLFVHGAWHASWCWEENYIPYFIKEGFLCHALDFRGHGQSEGREHLNSYHLTDFVEDLGQAAETAQKPPVLVAHSMGGLVAQMYAQDHEVAGLVLLAPVPISGVGYGYASAHPLAFLKFLLTRSGKAMIGGEKLSKRLFFSENFPDELFRRHYQRLQDESYHALVEIGPGTKWKHLKGNPPVLIVEAGKDALIPKDRLAETAKLYGTNISRMDNLAHDMMLDVEWSMAAVVVSSWLNENNL